MYTCMHMILCGLICICMVEHYLINTMIVYVHVYAHTVCSESQTCVHLAPPPNEIYFNVEPHCRTSIPGSRYGHTVCSYRDKVYMYGGRNDEDGSFSNVDCYDISKSKRHGSQSVYISVIPRNVTPDATSKGSLCMMIIIF